jgi:uncharacterized membrane protein
MGRFFWLLMFCAAALATHAGYVLFYPSFEFDKRITALMAPTANNTLALLDARKIVQLFPAYAASDVVAVCRYDLSSGPVRITARMPRGYWTMSIYSDRGEQVYSITDAQAGNNSFTVELTQEPGLLAQVKGILHAETETEAIGTAGWKVQTPDARGLAVIWAPVADPLFRDAAVAAALGSTCEKI